MSNSPVFPFAARLPPGTPIRSAGYQWLEPYEGKLSRTVLRGGRAGNSSLPLDPNLIQVKKGIEEAGKTRPNPAFNFF